MRIIVLLLSLSVLGTGQEIPFSAFPPQMRIPIPDAVLYRLFLEQAAAFETEARTCEAHGKSGKAFRHHLIHQFDIPEDALPAVTQAALEFTSRVNELRSQQKSLALRFHGGLLQPATGHQQAPAPASVAPVAQRPFTPPVAVHRQNPIVRPGIVFSNVVVPALVKISETGKVTSVALAVPDSSLRPEISREALAAAGKWRFSPATIGDKPISSEMRINFVFRHSPSNDGAAP